MRASSAPVSSDGAQLVEDQHAHLDRQAGAARPCDQARRGRPDRSRRPAPDDPACARTRARRARHRTRCRRSVRPAEPGDRPTGRTSTSRAGAAPGRWRRTPSSSACRSGSRAANRPVGVRRPRVGVAERGVGHPPGRPVDERQHRLRIGGRRELEAVQHDRGQRQDGRGPEPPAAVAELVERPAHSKGHEHVDVALSAVAQRQQQLDVATRHAQQRPAAPAQDPLDPVGLGDHVGR